MSHINLTKILLFVFQESQSLSVTRSNTSSALDQDDERRRREELAFKYVTFFIFISLVNPVNEFLYLFLFLINKIDDVVIP